MRGMMIGRMGLAAVLAATAAAMGIAAVPAAAQNGYSKYDESAAGALARYVRTLASDAKDFSALIGAGRSALALGDTQAAAGFFARADEVNPKSPLPQAGMGAVQVAKGEPQASMAYFTRAQRLGAPVATFGADRGLAYDLLGQQAKAQADYRAALGGSDSDEARRRLALSLAIGGDKAGALEALAPLTLRPDPETNRVRAFVLALTGNSNAAMIAFDRAMPGSWARVAPFLKQLPHLAPAQKAAAVNLGIFPEGGATAYAYAAPAQSYPLPASDDQVANVDAYGRLTAVDQLLGSQQAAPASQVTASPPAAQPVQMASLTVTRQVSAKGGTAIVSPDKRYWVQLASGSDANALPGLFERIKSNSNFDFDGIEPYVAEDRGRARLLVGPFKDSDDAETFAANLESARVDAFRWTRPAGQMVRKLPTE